MKFVRKPHRSKLELQWISLRSARLHEIRPVFAELSAMRILFTAFAVATCCACVFFLFDAAWTNVLISSIVFVLSLMGLEVVRIRETMARPIDQVIREYLEQHPIGGVYAPDSTDSDEKLRGNVFKLKA